MMSNLNAYLFKFKTETLLGAKYYQYMWLFATSPKQAKQLLNKYKKAWRIDTYSEPLDWFNGNCFNRAHQVGDVILGTKSDEKL